MRIAQANGHFVIATSRNPSRTPELVAEVEGKGGKWTRLDVDEADSAKVLENLEKDGHAVDVLVNNAGFGLYGAAEQFTDEEVRRQFETNFFGPYRLTRTAVRYMRERRFGIIVNISSGAAFYPVPSMGIYGSAKAALDSKFYSRTCTGHECTDTSKGVHKTLAVEMADFNVRVLSVTPGVFDTSIISALQFQEQPLDKDYEGKSVGYMLGTQKSGDWKPDGSTKKAVKAIYEVVVGEGVGQDKENEPCLPLGRDAIKVLEGHNAQWDQTLKSFREVGDNVHVDTEATLYEG